MKVWVNSLIDLKLFQLTTADNYSPIKKDDFTSL